MTRRFDVLRKYQISSDSSKKRLRNRFCLINDAIPNPTKENMMRFRRLVKFCPSGVGIAAISLASIASGPNVNAQGIQPSGLEPLLTAAVDYKSTANLKETKATEEAAQFWNWSANLGYTSEYIFRGTNL